MSESSNEDITQSPRRSEEPVDEVERLRQQLHNATMMLQQNDSLLTHLNQEAVGEMQRREQELQHKEREVLQYMRTMEESRKQSSIQQTQSSAFVPIVNSRTRTDPTQTAVLGVIDQWATNNAPDPILRNSAMQGQQPAFPPRHQYSAPHSIGSPQQLPSASGNTRYLFNAPAPAASQMPVPGKQYPSIPLPRQMTYDGVSSWQSFILPFKSLASACQWTEEEKRFRLCNSLRGEAAEYAFAQLTPEAVSSFELLEQALHSRFAEKCTTASYLAQLEARKL